MQTASRENSSDHDKPVARLEVWLARLAVLATGAALLATSPAPRYSYTFSKSVVGPQVELTASAPSARFLVTARALGLAPSGSPTTGAADAILEGSLTQDAAAKFVTARVAGSSTGPGGSKLTALTSFRLAQGLTFSGTAKRRENKDRMRAHSSCPGAWRSRSHERCSLDRGSAVARKCRLQRARRLRRAE